MIGPGRAGADRSIVDAHDRHDLARRAGEEHFVGRPQIVRGQHALRDARMPSSRPSSSTNSRVMPGSRPAVERRRQHGAVRAPGRGSTACTRPARRAWFRISASTAPRANASCIASALFSRLFDLISGFSACGWLRTDADERDVTPSRERPLRRLDERLDDDDERRRRAGGRVVGQLADAAREQDADVGFACVPGPAARAIVSRTSARRSRRRRTARRAPACAPTAAAAACGGRRGTARRCRCAASRRRLRRTETRDRRPEIDARGRRRVIVR